MSSNPFRRSQGSRLADENTLDRAPSPANSKAKKKKRVVIQTPPHSPEEPSIPRKLSDGKTGSPPPPTSSADDDETDSTTTADSDLERALVNTRRNSGSMPPPPTSFGAIAGSRAPANPFARTLATSEASFGLQTSEERGGRGDGFNSAAGQPRAAGSKPVLDVDMFKSILLTGSATPSPPASTPATRPQDSSSSTDTSSLSRQSIFDPIHDIHPESPRTSFDDHLSPSDDDDEDEQSSLMGPVSLRPVEEGPPAPPKPKHGRPFPQTVSFADFDEDIPSSFTHAGLKVPHINTQLPGIMRPTTPRSPSDLNKPLPPPPAGRASSDQAPSGFQQTANTPTQEEPTAATPTQPIEAKKPPPPPPPTSRRQGQASGSHGRARSTSNLSQGSVQPMEADDLPSSSVDQSTRIVPPPPPSRRPQSISQSPSPAVESPVPAPTLEQPGPAVKVMPPPPPRRGPARMGSSLTRTSSNTSRSSLPRSESFSNNTASANAPPAPPPRRAGASKRNSMDGPPNSMVTRRASTDQRRTSGQSFESDKSVSLSSLQQVDEPGEHEKTATSSTLEKPERDVLADMLAFQAEIEALRARAGQNG